jgi:hypothetical protein
VRLVRSPTVTDGRYDPEDDGAGDLPEPREEAQPDHFCDCRPGAELRQPWQHADTCHRWAPPLTGPGSTPAGRAAALAQIRATLAARRTQEPQP